MNPQQQTPAPENVTAQDPATPTPDATTPLHAPATAHNTTVILGVLAVIIVVLALLFMWSSQVAAPVVIPGEQEVVVPTPEQEPTPEEAVSMFEAELDMSEIETLDSELDALEAELDVELSAVPAE